MRNKKKKMENSLNDINSMVETVRFCIGRWLKQIGIKSEIINIQ